PLPRPSGSVLDRVRSRGVLRVGYFDNSLPYAFRIAAGDLVGLDIEMAQQLARDLGVGLELVPADQRLLDIGLDPSACDLVMSGVVVTADRSLHVRYSSAYLDAAFAFLVAAHRRAEFASWDEVEATPALRSGVPNEPYYLSRIRARLPAATIVPLDSPDRGS